MHRLIATTALISLIVAVPAVAAPKSQDQKQQQTEQQAPKPGFAFVTAQGQNDWSAEALIGRSVENPKGERLGDINNVILGQQGSVKAVTIGVGGFLGIGEKDVGVPFSALQFKERADRPATRAEPPAATPSQLGRATAPDAATPANQTPPERLATKQQQAQQQQQQAQQRDAEQRRAQAEDRRQEQLDARYDSEHANIAIVLNATKTQLDAAPEFAWLDDQRPGNDQSKLESKRTEEPKRNPKQ